MPPSIASLRRGRSRLAGIVVALLILQLLFKIALAPKMLTMGLSGDESAYLDVGKALSNVIRDLVWHRGVDSRELTASVISNGWFMPGMGFVLAPLYLFVPDAGLALVRGYLGAFTFLLFVWTVLEVWHAFGVRTALALALFPALTPVWLMFSFTAWGELSAGLIAVVTMARSFLVARAMADEKVPRLRDCLSLGALLAACVYLRSSLLPLVPVLLAILVLGTAVFYPRGARRKMLARLGMAGLVAVGLILPWSVSVSSRFDQPILTTTSVPLSLAISFGDVDRLCFGPCGKGNVWFNSVRYSRQIADYAGTSELAVQKHMADYALAETSVGEYSKAVLVAFHRYLLHPTSFLGRFTQMGVNFAMPRVYAASTKWPYFIMMLFMVLGILMISRGPREVQIASVLLKLFAGAMILQPFFSISHGRYWPVFAPLFAISLGVLVSQGKLAGPRKLLPVAASGIDRAGIALLVLQAVGLAAFLMIAIFLFGLDF